MELAKVTSKGQITIPLMIRNLLQLKTGDKVFFEESRGKVYITNASQITLANVQTQMHEIFLCIMFNLSVVLRL